MDAQARAARYGNISPTEFDEMEYEYGAELARRVVEMAQKDMETNAELHVELTKALIKAQGGKLV
jgi:hypothetical protein